MMSVLTFAVALQVPVPQTITFAAFVDEEGAPIDRNAVVSFALFDAPSGGTEVWRENDLFVDIIQGALVVDLGERNPLGPAILAGPRFVELTVDGETLSPRVPWSSTPFSIVSGYAQEAATVPLAGVTGLEAGIPLYMQPPGCEFYGMLTPVATCPARRCFAHGSLGFETCAANTGCVEEQAVCETIPVGRLLPNPP
jgi:hypothetical protein